MQDVGDEERGRGRWEGSVKIKIKEPVSRKIKKKAFFANVRMLSLFLLLLFKVSFENS